MIKDGRLYGRFTQDFPDNPKIMPLSDKAFRCLVEATLWSCKQQTDGLLPSRYAVARWGQATLDELTSNDYVKPSLDVVENGFMIHDFAQHQETKADIEARRERNKLNGQKGGQAKAKRLGKRGASESPSEPLADKDKEVFKRSRSTTSSSTGYSDEFSTWWEHYPRKVAKGAAAKRFAKAIKLIDVDTLIAATDRFAASVRDEDRKYVPHPATWLNDRRWEDDDTATTGVTAPVAEKRLRDAWKAGIDSQLAQLPRTPFEVEWPDPMPETTEERDQVRLELWRHWLEDNHAELIAALTREVS